MYTFSILVNTTDRFEDCWMPFFKLFKEYWSKYSGKVYLNTEHREFVYPGINIVSVKNCQVFDDASQVTWSQCLIRALEAIDTDVILYLQEDYFLNGHVDDGLIESYAKLINEKNIDCIHLSPASGPGPFSSSDYPNLWTVDRKAAFRISCQAALWKKSVLIKYLRSYESAWQFEEFGTRRSHVLNDVFLTVDREFIKSRGKEIIPYFRTGIVQGRWDSRVRDLLDGHNIMVDYGIRGFHRPGKLPFRKTLKRKIQRVPKMILSELDLLRMKLIKFF